MTASIRAGLALLGKPAEDSLAVARDVCIHVSSDGIIESIETGSSCPRSSLGSPAAVAVPPPALAHVHSADNAFPEYGAAKTLPDLVEPGRGEKHERLQGLARRDLVAYTREFYLAAWRRGVGLLADYRELGGLGCETAREAASGVPPGLDVAVLGRPGPGWPSGCEGAGLPSPLNYSLEELKRIARLFPITSAHVAETPLTRELGDLELALEAGIRVLVHGTFLSQSDLDALEDAGSALVLSVGSNMWHGLGLPPVRELLDRGGIALGVGTDNAAWSPPDPWSEAMRLLSAARLHGARMPRHAERLASALFYEPYLMYGREPPRIEEGAPARIVVARPLCSALVRSEEPLWGLLKRMTSSTVTARIEGPGVFYIEE